MSELNFEITRKIGVLSQGGRGWNKELNMVSWNGGEPKLDIRSWSPDYSRMSKGVTLSLDEAATLKKVLEEIELG